jgi:hypothetical protein
MAARLVLLLGCLLPAAGCLESSFSSSPHPLPAASIAESSSDDAQPSIEPAPAATTLEETPAAAPVAQASPPAANKLLPTKDITFDDIKFDIEKDAKFERSMLTPKIEELSGRCVRIRGYILPTFQQSGIRNFVLVRDNMECCFGPGAAIYDCIIVDMVGATAEFTTRPVTVDGGLTFREVLDFDGITRAIYHLDATAVK